MHVTKPVLGGHIPVNAGLSHVILNTRALGYNAVQLMLGDGRSYDPIDFEEKSADEFRKMTYGVQSYVHLPYVINPCEDQVRRANFYKHSFRKYARISDDLDVRGLVLHPGFKKELTEAKALENLIKFVDTVWEEHWSFKLLLETDAGSNNESAIGSAAFIENAIIRLGSERVGMCIDTEHLYARGTDLWDEATRKQFVSQYGSQINLVHLNSPDPNVELGSHRDRHSTPFSMREWDHVSMIHDLAQWPLILERSSLAVQAEDAKYVRGIIAPEQPVLAVQPVN